MIELPEAVVLLKQLTNTLTGKEIVKVIATLSKSTMDSPCKRYDSQIIKESYLGGSIYYCSGCQSL